MVRKLTVSTLEMYLDKRNIKCAKGLLKQGKLDVISTNIARILVQRLTREEEDVDEDDDLDDELDGDDMALGEIGKDSESEEEFDDDDNSDDDGAAADDDDDDDDDDVDVDVCNVLHVIYSRIFVASRSFL